ncbi:MAG: hypothetical protein E7409_03160 [Ruminococcaceae bacterium]|nr:hypothetical protein [Oscillospiraceae bacterium]
MRAIDIKREYGEIFVTSGAKWIGRAGVTGNESAPAPLVRKRFVLEKDVEEATLSVTGMGQYEGFVNGASLDERIVFAPNVSDYNKTVYYNKYSVSEKLCKGENVFVFVLGRGRYAYNTVGTPWNGETAPWIDAVKMIAVLEITYTDGTTETLVTDESWQTKPSGIMQDCMYMGETFDARLHDPAWLQAESTGWELCAIVEAPKGQLKFDYTDPIIIEKKIAPISCTKIRDKVFVYKFDTYITGWIELNINCPEGREVSIQYAERTTANSIHVDEDEVKAEVLLKQEVTPNGRLQRDYFISSGIPMVYRPMFSYKGFYYVQVDGIDHLTVDDAVGCFVHSEVESINDFRCSNELINWIHNAFRHTGLCNFHGIPTDTPVFEKHGWAGDACASHPGILFNYDMRLFYRKWLEDFRDAQIESGEIPCIVPTPGWGLSGFTSWQDVCGPVPSQDLCYVELTYRMYWCYNDIDILKEHYGALRKYILYAMEFDNGKLHTMGTGDWLAPTGDPMTAKAVPPEGPDLVASALQIRIFEFMEKIADALGKDDHAAEYAAERRRLIALYNETYFDSKRMFYRCERYDDYRQAPQVIALAFGIPEEKHREAILAHVPKDLEANDYHPWMGLGCSQYLPMVLTEMGHHDIAYKVLNVKGYPGWDNMRRLCMDSLPESWEIDVSRSFCHYTFGAVDRWIMQYLAGIHQLAPGFRKVRIAPLLPEEMDFLEYTLDTVSGSIFVRCERKDGEVITTVRADSGIEIIK